jgi:hypothetical protein
MAAVTKINLEEHTYNETLSIQVSLDGFSFYAQDKNTGGYDEIVARTEENADSPEKILRKIEQVFEDHAGILKTFNTVDVVYRNELFTIVPSALFDPERLTDYLKYNTKILSTDFIVFDEIKPFELIVIYIPFANINNFFFDRFGSFSYHHHMTVFIEKVLDNASNSQKQAVVNLDQGNFEIVAHEGKKMLLANSFTYENAEDFLYHILFCYEQLNFDPNRDTLVINGQLDKNGALYQLTQTYIRHIKLVEKSLLSA